MLTPLASTANPPFASDYNIRHSHYRRVPSSQRSLSPPPPQKKQLSFKTIKNALCLPLCRNGSPKEDIVAEEPLVNKYVEISTISSEEQTRAPDGDKLPVFTRLRDWTEYQRETRLDNNGDEKSLPPRSASLPAPKTSPAFSLQSRARTASDGRLPKLQQEARSSKPVAWYDVPTFECSDAVVRKSCIPPTPPPPPPKIPLRKSVPRRHAKELKHHEATPTPLSASTRLFNTMPPGVPPKIPTSRHEKGCESTVEPSFPFTWNNRVYGYKSGSNHMRAKKRRPISHQRPPSPVGYNRQSPRLHEYHREPKTEHHRHCRKRHHRHTNTNHRRPSHHPSWRDVELEPLASTWTPGIWRVFEALHQ
ncbi:hypothetical protein H072_2201 [Dactylellina haptotyla CBS 200.50]|uniref:Uncharacterized protein n=1 Tax=Dactylellina haptotyla (strain CBS 200.50) TaxID=1284197 RepID=S8C7U9_DACHA|nr:hypothetical protein H072_2201 [Dactylellina haptotyla CBS 200.50]